MTQLFHIVVPSVTIVAGVNDAFSIDEGSGPLACTIAANKYYLRGDASGADLLEAVLDALNAAGADAYTADFAVNASGILLDIFNGTGTNTITWGAFDGLDIGFSTDLAIEAEFNSDQCPRGFWIPDETAQLIDDVPSALGNQIQTVGGQTYTHDRSGQIWTGLRIIWQWLEEDHVEFTGLASTAQPRTLYACWARWRDGRSVEIHETVLQALSLTTTTLKGEYVLDGAHLEQIRATRQGPGVPFYDCEPILWREWVD